MYVPSVNRFDRERSNQKQNFQEEAYWCTWKLCSVYNDDQSFTNKIEGLVIIEYNSLEYNLSSYIVNTFILEYFSMHWKMSDGVNNY